MSAADSRFKGALYTTGEVQQLEQLAMQADNCSVGDLMQRAGQAAFDVLTATWPKARSMSIYTGKGNNAGDGFVLAKLLHEAGFMVSVRALVPLADLSDTAKTVAQSCADAGIPILSNDQQAVDKDADILVDAILGTGYSGSELPNNFVAAITQLSDAKVPVLSLDVPTGVVADTGEVPQIAVKAAVTVSFLVRKRGLFTGDALNYVGNLVWHEIGVKQAVRAQGLTGHAALLGCAAADFKLPKRQSNTHKGSYGHVVVVGGNQGMGGAAVLAAMASQRAGAGKVSLLTHAAHAAEVVANHPSLLCHAFKAADQASALLEQADVVAVGPGLGQDDWGQQLLALVKREHPQDCVLDADALNLSAADSFKGWQAPIITPHPVEAARILRMAVDDVQQDRFTAIEALLAKTGAAAAVLKGAGSLVRGQSDCTWVCNAGNPGMAAAGMGDVLSGVVAGLLAQAMVAEEAACAAVWAHARAGDYAVNQQGGQAGLIAEDVLAYLPAVLS